MNKFIADIYRSAAEDVKCHKYCSNYWMGNAKYKTMATFAFDFKNYYINKKNTIVSHISGTPCKSVYQCQFQNLKAVVGNLKLKY